MFLFCLMFAMSLCTSVYMCFVVTCWERADLLAHKYDILHQEQCLIFPFQSCLSIECSYMVFKSIQIGLHAVF